jgi:hypothetical protein
MYKLKNVAKRGSALAGAIGLLVGIGTSAMPALVSADSLNPLTERSLTLSSSSPGWAYTDGSGNSTYAGPNTGTNGKKTGNTFSFRVTTDTATSGKGPVKAFTFQYCTTPAGLCQAPGNDTPETLDTSDANPANWTTTAARGGDDDANRQTDLFIHTNSPTEIAGDDYATLSADGTATGTSTTGSGSGANYGDVKQVPDGEDTVSPYAPTHPGDPDGTNNIAGSFVVLVGNSASGHVDTYSSGWTMTAANQEEVGIIDNGATGTDPRTTKPNMITLTNTTGLTLARGDYVKIMFFGTDSNYITNPGQGAFFVKINDYNSTSTFDDTTIEDGGVTVANVMNQSIAIQTKVLETMEFSVGTVDPDTLTPTELATAYPGHSAHSECDPIRPSLNPSTDPDNVLIMGNSNAENSLDTTHTYATHSYWRLSSNSSGGATVYYAGNTLSNTEGDKIDAIGKNMAAPSTGGEQFGLALDNNTSGPYAVDYAYAKDDVPNSIALETGADYGAASHGAALDSTASTGWVAYQAANPGKVHNPQLAPLSPTTDYGSGTGGINTLADPDGGGPLTGETIGTQFAFDPTSQTVPTAIATENTNVVNCVTGKMRYVANIAATTPAGIYTTKINYIAAPQY